MAGYHGAHEHVEAVGVLLKKDADSSEAWFKWVRPRRAVRGVHLPALTSAAVVMEREPSCAMLH
jgi:hypothetical protein